MGDAELTVLVVDDDFRVANMHAGIVNALPGFAVAATVNTLAAAREAECRGPRAGRRLSARRVRCRLRP